MNTNDGTIHEMTKADLMEMNGGPMVEVNKKDMTLKQKKNKKVSLHDHRSKLGQQLTRERKMRGKSGIRQQQRKMNIKKG